MYRAVFKPHPPPECSHKKFHFICYHVKQKYCILFSPKAFCVTKSALKRRFSARDPPDLSGGAHDAAPDPLVGWRGGTPIPNPHPLDAFAVSISAPLAPHLTEPRQICFTYTVLNSSNATEQSISGLWRQHLERSADTRDIRAVTWGLQTTSQDIPFHSFISEHFNLTYLLTFSVDLATANVI